MKIIVISSFFASFLVSQNDIDILIQDVLNGSRDSVAIYLPIIEKNYPNHPKAMYLKGLVATDGKKAMDIFANLYNTHPTSKYGSDAVMKVAEYYYAAGLYVQAAEWLKKMPLYYSRSIHIERAIKLFLNSLIVSGHRDTAIFYSRVFKKQFPSLDVDGKIRDLLMEYEESKHQQKQKKIQEYTSKERMINHPNNASSLISRTESILGYSLQSGAYEIKTNAIAQSKNLNSVGFDSRIIELNRKKQILFAVRIGHYNSKQDAETIGERIKSRLNIETIVVKDNR